MNGFEPRRLTKNQSCWISAFDMDPERMMTSVAASGFPQFMREVFENLDFEDLLKTRLTSMTFYEFLMDKSQRRIWMRASSKVLSTFLQYTYDLKRFPVLQTWTLDQINHFQQKWIEVFEKIKEVATIPQLIKICNLLRETETPGKFCETSMFSIISIILEVSKDFENNVPSQQIKELRYYQLNCMLQ